MNISKSGIELIKRFEGLRLKAYQIRWASGRLVTMDAAS